VKLTIVVPAGARVAGLVVTRGGRPVPEAEWGTAVSVDPGEQVVEASAPNRVGWISRPQVDEHNRVVVVTVPDLPAAPLLQPQPSLVSAATPAPPPVAAVSMPAPPQPTGTRSVGGTAGIVLGGAGLVGLGVGVFFDVRAHRLAGQRDDAARAGDAGATATLNRDAHSAEKTAFIVGGAALVALGGGIALLVRSRTASDVSIAPEVTAGQIGFVMRVTR
jgi:hypothetical protein